MIGLDLSECQAAFEILPQEMAIPSGNAGAAFWCNLAHGAGVLHPGISMRSLLKPGLLIQLEQNEAGLIADLAILALFLVLLAAR